MNWKTLLFGFEGRINRAKLWLGVLVVMLTYIGGTVLGALLYATAGFIPAALFGLVAIIFVVWVILATGIKRLHDREKAGWWMLLLWVLPLALSTFGSILGVNDDNTLVMAGMALSLVSFAFSIWALVELGCLKGTTGPNQYGPDPLPAEPD